MRSASTLVIGIAGLAIWGIAVVAGARSVSTGEETAADFDPSTMETIDITEVPPATTPEVSAEEPDLSAPADVDDEQPSSSQPAETAAETTGETIIAQAAPQQPATAQTQAPDGGREGIDLPRPQTSGAGILTFGEKTVKLADIEPTDPARTCTGAGGTQWPCGMLARTQQRLFIRNRTVNCAIDSAEWQGTIEAHCRLGEIDLSSWLAENGWVDTPEGSPLRPLTEKAHSSRLGLFGGDPR
ncbi:thermonuclease family protein [Rhizobium sp. S153]|uniref:Thermonuclease family protein n=1 Tax=Ciceribacter sichuanensis TaxID=2949647 RepID=A0ABT0V5J5_9HYPH|nr:thermonuclease family protein [Ciceribacter sp. S153]MCM2401160.1 thermonuclease family protein [Ciceribacter sp. S153]